jgi:hypothetical protein
VNREEGIFPMLRDGSYAAWFHTPLGQGTGIAHVEGNRIRGCDSIMSYEGSCAVEGDRFTITISVVRHTEGHATVFGVDDLKVRLEGKFVGKIGTFVGAAEQVPGMVLEGTLIRSEEAGPEKSGRTPKFNLDKLPKLPTRSR